MLTAKSTDVQNNFGEYLEKAQREPVAITKHGRKPSALILSFEEYTRLNDIEDMYWALKAMKAEQEGYIGAEASMSLLNEINNKNEKI